MCGVNPITVGSVDEPGSVLISLRLTMHKYIHALNTYDVNNNRRAPAQNICTPIHTRKWR